MTIHIDKEKILCEVILDDNIGSLMHAHAGDTFWRAWVVQDRTTGDISAKFRFKFDDGKRDWWEIALSPQHQTMSTAARVAHLQEGLEKFIRSRVVKAHPQHLEAPRDAVTTRYPPDDKGDPNATMRWLEAEDLVHPPRFEAAK